MRAKTERGRMRQFRARPVITVSSTARPLITGRAPGWAVHTGQTCRLGGTWKCSAGQEQNIFDAVPSSTWTSMPMTVS